MWQPARTRLKAFCCSAKEGCLVENHLNRLWVEKKLHKLFCKAAATQEVRVTFWLPLSHLTKSLINVALRSLTPILQQPFLHQVHHTTIEEGSKTTLAAQQGLPCLPHFLHAVTFVCAHDSWAGMMDSKTPGQSITTPACKLGTATA